MQQSPAGCRLQKKSKLESQKNRRFDFCAAKGNKVSRVIAEVGSEINDT